MGYFSKKSNNAFLVFKLIISIKSFKIWPSFHISALSVYKIPIIFSLVYVKTDMAALSSSHSTTMYFLLQVSSSKVVTPVCCLSWRQNSKIAAASSTIFIFSLEQTAYSSEQKRSQINSRKRRWLLSLSSFLL